jgi:ATP phosphoribosyltransferase regulatory subunit
LTLYTDTILRALPAQRPPRRIYIPAGSDAAVAKRLRGEGWVTVAGLEPVADAAAEARRLSCGHRLEGDQIHTVS